MSDGSVSSLSFIDVPISPLIGKPFDPIDERTACSTINPAVGVLVKLVNEPRKSVSAKLTVQRKKLVRHSVANYTTCIVSTPVEPIKIAIIDQVEVHGPLIWYSLATEASRHVLAIPEKSVIS